MDGDTIDMSLIDMIPYIQSSPFSKIIDTSENLLNSFETASTLSTQVNLTEAPKRAELFSDKIFEKGKFNRLSTIILRILPKMLKF